MRSEEEFSIFAKFYGQRNAIKMFALKTLFDLVCLSMCSCACSWYLQGRRISTWFNTFSFKEIMSPQELCAHARISGKSHKLMNFNLNRQTNYVWCWLSGIDDSWISTWHNILLKFSRFYFSLSPVRRSWKFSERWQQTDALSRNFDPIETIGFSLFVFSQCRFSYAFPSLFVSLLCFCRVLIFIVADCFCVMYWLCVCLCIGFYQRNNSFMFMLQN